MSAAHEKNQLDALKYLLQSKDFARLLAEKQQNAYQKGIGEKPVPLVTPEDEEKTEEKPVVEQRIAINIAGFYALECGVGYLAKRDHKTIDAVLQEVVDETLDAGDKELLCRFANATWKAGQPFRSLDRITRDIFVPFDLLSEEEQLKDWVQIRSAAREVLGKTS